MFLLIDNYDSFTYNLVQAFQVLGKDPIVVKNDDPSLLDYVNNPDLTMVCISPGPGHPKNAGFCPEFLKKLDHKIPVLGVCLGHQLLALHAGAQIEVGPVIMHGKQSEIVHDGTGLFNGLPHPMQVGRYHSLVVNDEGSGDFKNLLKVTARAPEGEIMAIQYTDRPWVGVQFHPESVLTPDGLRLLGNFPQTIENRGEGFNLSNILETLANKQDLNAEMAAAGFAALMDGEMTASQAGSFLMGLRMKGESPLELAHAVRAALARAVRIEGISGKCIDVVGTGGDGKNSFNCSTTAALVLAGMGYKVVKHGNRAVSSTSGAADALEGLGITLDEDPKKAVEMLKKRNFAFLFAPFFHPSFKNIGPVRKELGIRTLFNILGPMINPARTSHLLMGVAKKELVPLVAETLVQSPLYRAAVVCGAGGYDEVTSMGPATIMMLHNGKMSKLDLDPSEYGFKPCSPEELQVHSKEEAVDVLKQLVEGRGPKVMLEMVSLNVGLALYLLEEHMDMRLCMARAREAVNAGMAKKVLNVS